MCEIDLSHITKVLRPVSNEVFNGKGKLCLSTVFLHKLNSAFEENDIEDGGSSFHLVQTSNVINSHLRDIQFMLDLLQKTIILKIIPDVIAENFTVSLNKFRNVKVLEIHKVNIKSILGIQKLRSQLQQLTCCYSVQNLGDILDRCGGDNSQRYSWNELKNADFSHNSLTELDSSFQCAPWLNTLNLSHNDLYNIEFLNTLPNLKYLNISYNKLEKVPRFKGQLCSRIQVLIISNNFIEDLSGLTSLINVLQLDLSQNCLLDHKSLLSVSHLPSLQWLNLKGNPVSFHPQHRNLTCNYLNKNTATLKFILDGRTLNKVEKSLIGFLYPVSLTSFSSSIHSSDESSTNSVQEKPKKIRNVEIEDDGSVKETKTVALTPNTSSQHLVIKKQVEKLRQEYGESWLYRDSGLLVQDVLGFEKSLILSSTPQESALNSFCVSVDNTSDTKSESLKYLTAETQPALNKSCSKEVFDAAHDNTEIFYTTADSQGEISDVSDGEDIYSGGEEGIYVANMKGEKDEVFVVVTDNHISERDVTTSKEKARWHINMILSCERVAENVVKIEFDTVRRNRKQRIYELDEAENFCNNVQRKIKDVMPEKKITYQCMKCSDTFERSLNSKYDQASSLTCPKCQSNLVVETV